MPPQKNIHNLAYYDPSGIYAIYSIDTDRVYIGQAKSIGRRWDEHLRDLYYDRHKNVHLQRIYNKYGDDALCFTILEECLSKNLNTREQYWAAQIDTDFLINQMNVGDALPISSEVKDKIRQKKIASKGKVANTGKRRLNDIQVNEIRQKIIDGACITQTANSYGVDFGTVKALLRGETYFLGDGIDKELITKAKEFLEKEYKSRIGSPQTEETKQKIREKRLGSINSSSRIFSEEQVNDMRQDFIDGLTLAQICKKHACKYSSLTSIICGKFYGAGDAVDKDLYEEAKNKYEANKLYKKTVNQSIKELSSSLLFKKLSPRNG